MITAHRGASFDAPENTLAAFQLAWQQNADAIEADFYLTTDRRILCIHDKDTLHMTGVKLVVEQSSFDQLRALEVVSPKHPAVRGERLPTFAEVLATVPTGKRFVIELKSGVEIVPHLVAELQPLAPPHDSLLIISFDAATIALCKQLLPDIRAHWLTDKATAQEAAKVVRESGADGVGLKGDRQRIDRRYIDELQAGGCREFHVWTIDDIEDAKFFQSLGAVGITTNRPAFIREGL